MQIEVGKRYVRRDGTVSGKLFSQQGANYTFYDAMSKISYTSQGCRFDSVQESQYDLMEEYIEPVSPSEVSGKEDKVEYDLSGIPAGYTFVGYRLVQVGDQYVGNAGGAKVFVATESDVTLKKLLVIVKPIAPPEPKQRTVVIHKWLVWDTVGKKDTGARIVYAEKAWINDSMFGYVQDLGLYEEVKVNV